MPVSARTHERMSREEFRAWTATLPEGERYELVGGFPVAMGPERVGHARTKARVWRAMADALNAVSAPCEALIDGVTVEIGEDTDYEPDVLINCGSPIPDDALVAPHPVVVVEVLSPGSQRSDTGIKLQDYFRLESIRHYLIVRVDRRSVILHSRAEDGEIRTSFLTERSRIELEPPGISLDVASFFNG